ncbi:universal stress protein [Halobacterium sp. R2-5]|uniref:universal stress protein n=1 Tax=Halobacterium sp. R2-5 TaxID=2715751 RepID=UPI00141ED2FA|nr:universal stress protein [Halobacterium sp. R2-5]NIB99828.1 universal stress protein [Halobacterium sp. R2-5]
MEPRHVLVPLDGSPLAEEALAHALDVFDCRTTVLRVTTPVSSGMSESGVLDRAEQRRETARERATELLEAARETASEAGRDVETVVEEGEPAETIVAYVEDSDVDHVVMGGHGGTSGIASRLLGTVATSVVAEAPVTVTVVR